MSTPTDRQLLAGVQRRLAEFSDIGEDRHLDGVFESPVHAKFGDGLGENHVGTGFDAGDRAFDGLLHAFHGRGIGARHDDELGVGTRIDRRFDAVHHFLLARRFPCRGDGRNAWPEPDPRYAARPAPNLMNDFTVRAMLNAPPQPVSASTSSGSGQASVMRRMSISTSSMVLMPRSGTPRELAATPPPDRYRALNPQAAAILAA